MAHIAEILLLFIMELKLKIETLKTWKRSMLIMLNLNSSSFQLEVHVFRRILPVIVFDSLSRFCFHKQP